MGQVYGLLRLLFAILDPTDETLDSRKIISRKLRSTALGPMRKRDLEGSLSPCPADADEVSAGVKVAQPSTASVVANVARGAGALSLGPIITTVGQLAVIPVAMRFWGPPRWGEWTVLAGMVSVFAMADLGMQSFVVNRMSAAYARGQTHKLCATLLSALIVNTPVAALVFVSFGLILWLAPVPRLLGLKTIGGFELSTLLMLLALKPLLGTIMGTVGGVYRATRQMARGAMIGNTRHAASLALLILVVGMKGNFLAVATAQLLVDFTVTAWIIKDLRRRYPWLKLSPRLGSLRDGLSMIVPGLFFLLIPMANSIGNDLIVLIVQRVHGGKAVSQFVTHRTAVNCARMLGSTLAHAAWPEITMLHARGEQRRLAIAHRSLAKASFWTVGFTVALIAAVFPYVYGFWTSGRLAPDYLTLGLLVARVAVWGLSNGSVTTLLALNRQREIAIATFWSAVVAGILALVLVPRTGIAGAALALLIGDLCGTAWLAPVLACRETGENVASFLAHVLTGPVASFTVGSALVAGGGLLFSRSALRDLLAIPLGASAAVIIMWIWSSRAERQVVKSMTRAVWPRFKLRSKGD